MSLAAVHSSPIMMSCAPRRAPGERSRPPPRARAHVAHAVPEAEDRGACGAVHIERALHTFSCTSATFSSERRIGRPTMDGKMCAGKLSPANPHLTNCEGGGFGSLRAQRRARRRAGAPRFHCRTRWAVCSWDVCSGRRTGACAGDFGRFAPWRAASGRPPSHSAASPLAATVSSPLAPASNFFKKTLIWSDSKRVSVCSHKGGGCGKGCSPAGAAPERVGSFLSLS